MDEQVNNRQLFLAATARCIKTLRDILRAQDPAPQQLTDAIQVVGSFKRAASGVKADSSRLICSHLEDVFLGYLTAKTIPSKIELETVKLAVDWLEQLSILYEENQPEPESLLSELFYAFDLVKYSHDAAILEELLVDNLDRDSAPCSDPFFEDSTFAVENRSGSFCHDPFEEDQDSGLDMESDLLQRTLNSASGTKNIAVDPFIDDPVLNVEIDKGCEMEIAPAVADSTYDLFADDPSLLDDPDIQS
jgi:hypothetical protein